VDNNAILVTPRDFAPGTASCSPARDLHNGAASPSKPAAKENIMSRRFVSFLSAVTLVAVLSPLAVSLGAAEVTCQVPFSFAVNGTPMPAGRYTVSTQDSALTIRSVTRTAIVLGQPTRSLTRTTTKLVFDKMGDEYTLREVWLDGFSGRTFPKARGHEDRKSAATNASVEQVVIAAR
jgi:hypothetical protein